jgi:EmrB/QacA subfamily drug resistance transporter
MSDTSAAAPADDETFCPAARRRHVLWAAILASSMGFIDGSVISIATPAIRADLGASLADAQWIANAYLLLLSSVLLVGGAAGDRFGLRRVFMAGIALFVAASITCALAPDALSLIFARAVQGLGAALMVPGSLAIIAKAYPRAERGKAIGIWAAASSLTTIFGPVLGGAVLTWFGDWSWRLVFAINLPIGGAALALLWFFVPADQPEAGRRLDLVGGALATLALLLMALGLTADSESGMLQSLLLVCGGIAVLVSFLVWEARFSAPMLPLRLFGHASFSGAQGLTFALYFSLAAITFYLPMTLIAGWGVTAAEVSVVLLPLGIALTVLSPVAGTFADRLGPGPLIAAGSALVGLSFLLMGLTASLHQLWLVLLPLTLLFGTGMGLVVSPLSTAVMTSVADDDTGVASGVNNAVARVAGLFAVATMGAVIASVFTHALGGFAELEVFFGVAPETPLDTEAEAARVAATDAAFAAVAYITAGLSALSGVIAWFTQERKIWKNRATASRERPTPSPGR